MENKIKLFENKVVFSNPKPTELIKKYVPNGPIAVKEYPTAAIKKYAGRLFLAGQCGTSAIKNDSGRLYFPPKKPAPE